MSNSNSKSNPNRDRGTEDRRQGRYNPPDGTGWTDSLTQQIFGETQANKDYRKGYEEEKRRRG